MTERFGFRVVPVHLGLVTSDYGVHEVRVTVCGVQHVLVRPGNQTVPSFSLRWKSDETIKHYPTQMLLAINWRYWQAEKYSHMHMKVQGRLMQVHFIDIHQVFGKENKIGYFSHTHFLRTSNVTMKTKHA